MKKFFLSILFLFLLYGTIQAKSSFQNNDSIVTATIALINQDSVHNYIQALQDMQTRFMIAPNRKSVAEWIKNKFISLGIDSVRIDSCTCYSNIHYGNLQFDTTTWQYNVIATIVGSVEPENTSIICAHYDDAVIYGAPLVFAPGADDNASGVATLFETARVLSLTNYSPNRTIELIAFAAEELINFGTSGSRCYVNQAYANNKQIEMVINNDAIGYNTGNWTVNILGLTGFESLANLMSEMRSQFTSLNEYKHIYSTLQGTDCQPFFEKGYSTVFICENSDNTTIHTNGDVIGLVDMNYCAEVSRMSCAVVMHSDFLLNINSSQEKESSLKVFPNPASDILYFKTDIKFQPQYYIINDLQGKTILKGNLPNKTNVIDINNLAKGFYTMQLTDGNQIQTAKFIKN